LWSVVKAFFYKIFDTKICPQLLYGSEIWGANRYDDLERVQIYACKRFMCSKQNASNAAVLGDCARHSLYVRTCIIKLYQVLA